LQQLPGGRHQIREVVHVHPHHHVHRLVRVPPQECEQSGQPERVGTPPPLQLIQSCCDVEQPDCYDTFTFLVARKALLCSSFGWFTSRYAAAASCRSGAEASFHHVSIEPSARESFLYSSPSFTPTREALVSSCAAFRLSPVARL